MTTRQFDPVFSTALRAELESLADRQEAAPAPAPRRILLRPQVWISLATALMVVAATLGVLRLTTPPAPPADPAPGVIDPLSRITDPGSPSYVARSVTTLLDVRGTGSGTRSFDVPGGVTDMRLYVNCSGTAKYSIAIDDGDGGSGSSCDRDSGSSYGMAVTAGRHEVAVTVPRTTRYALTIIQTPAPTVSAGALIDPLTQVRDLRDPDAMVGDTRPLLRVGGQGDGRDERLAVPAGVRGVRVFLACRPTSAATTVRIDGRTVSGCMNTIAHWFDLTPSAGTISARVTATAGVRWALLVVPAPKGAKDSRTAATLPYPTVRGPLLAKARGVGARATGTFVGPGSSVLVTTTCRGTGWLEMTMGASGTSTRGQACSAKPATVGFGGGPGSRKPQRWSVTPHGDISWTFQLSGDD